jgi:hypothetical protein
MSKVYIFKEAQHKSGTSQKTGNPYEFRKLRFADPDLFDVHQLDYDPKLDKDVTLFSNGDKVHLVFSLVSSNYQGQDSRSVVTSVLPVK